MTSQPPKRSALASVLTVNGGSLSIKFALFETGGTLRRILEGRIEGIGQPKSTFEVKGFDQAGFVSLTIHAPNHIAAVNKLMEWIGDRIGHSELAAVGHRVVHGGPKYWKPQRITPKMVKTLHQLSPFDPEHLPEEILLTEAFHKRFPKLPQIACFDTAFHRHLPGVASMPPIPRRYEAKGVRRYGFHGLPCEYLLEELGRVAGAKAAGGRVILAHLGKHCTAGLGIWEWASNDRDREPDVVMACAGDVPTLETLAAVQILRQHFPELKIRVINGVDLMTLQPQSEHPHGLSDKDFDVLFTKDKPTIFAFHGYLWLIHRLTYRRTNHGNLHVRGYKEEGTTTTPFDMVVLNEVDRFHLVGDVVDRVPNLGPRGAYAKQIIRDKLIDHKKYVREHGEDMPEVRNWKWQRK